ncbi:hypothetical protein M231_00894 [Tremella mesenterica]|uniref:BZIP domain-containing protein n=1 Tax=Tremella mesenterica TaxID=5217 RepID=A0A4Q1BUX0_TREME|nr:hypothetical protein M231_00894 [Tremella mesenterica]
MRTAHHHQLYGPPFPSPSTSSSTSPNKAVGQPYAPRAAAVPVASSVMEGAAGRYEDEEEYDSSGDEIEKRKLESRREKNRVKQRNLRQRRAEHISGLEKTVAALQKENSSLSSSLSETQSRENKLHSWVKDLENALYRNNLSSEVESYRRIWTPVLQRRPSTMSNMTINSNPIGMNVNMSMGNNDPLSTLAQAAASIPLSSTPPIYPSSSTPPIFPSSTPVFSSSTPPVFSSSTPPIYSSSKTPPFSHRPPSTNGQRPMWNRALTGGFQWDPAAIDNPYDYDKERNERQGKSRQDTDKKDRDIFERERQTEEMRKRKRSLGMESPQLRSRPGSSLGSNTERGLQGLGIGTNIDKIGNGQGWEREKDKRGDRELAIPWELPLSRSRPQTAPSSSTSLSMTSMSSYSTLPSSNFHSTFSSSSRPNSSSIPLNSNSTINNSTSFSAQANSSSAFPGTLNFLGSHPTGSSAILPSVVPGSHASHGPGSGSTSSFSGHSTTPTSSYFSTNHPHTNSKLRRTSTSYSHLEQKDGEEENQNSGNAGVIQGVQSSQGVSKSAPSPRPMRIESLLSPDLAGTEKDMENRSPTNGDIPSGSPRSTQNQFQHLHIPHDDTDPRLSPTYNIHEQPNPHQQPKQDSHNHNHLPRGGEMEIDQSLTPTPFSPTSTSIHSPLSTQKTDKTYETQTSQGSQTVRSTSYAKSETQDNAEMDKRPKWNSTSPPIYRPYQPLPLPLPQQTVRPLIPQKIQRQCAAFSSGEGISPTGGERDLGGSNSRERTVGSGESTPAVNGEIGNLPSGSRSGGLTLSSGFQKDRRNEHGLPEGRRIEDEAGSEKRMGQRDERGADGGVGREVDMGEEWRDQLKSEETIIPAEGEMRVKVERVGEVG